MGGAAAKAITIKTTDKTFRGGGRINEKWYLDGFQHLLTCPCLPEGLSRFHTFSLSFQSVSWIIFFSQIVCLYTCCKGSTGIKDKPYISSGKMSQAPLTKEDKRECWKINGTLLFCVFLYCCFNGLEHRRKLNAETSISV